MGLKHSSKIAIFIYVSFSFAFWNRSLSLTVSIDLMTHLFVDIVLGQVFHVLFKLFSQMIHHLLLWWFRLWRFVIEKLYKVYFLVKLKFLTFFGQNLLSLSEKSLMFFIQLFLKVWIRSKVCMVMLNIHLLRFLKKNKFSWSDSIEGYCFSLTKRQIIWLNLIKFWYSHMVIKNSN